MATYDNDLRLTELTTGDEIGSWGDVSNLNLELIAESLSYATQDGFASDADATTTVADGATDPARSMYFKVTSSATLTATRTLTIAPNDMSRVMFIENATTGGQSITIAQGSGGTVTIPNGANKLIYLDGAGAGGAVVDISSKLALDGTVIGGTTPAAGTFTAVTVDNIVIDGDVINYGAGDVTQTFTANSLAFAGASSGYSFDSDLILAQDIVSSDDTSAFRISGGTSVGSGGNIVLFPDNHASSPRDINFRDQSTSVLRYDANNNSGTWEFNSAGGVEIQTGDLGIGTTPSQKLDVNGTVNIGDGNTRLNISASGSGAVINNVDNSSLEFGTSNTTRVTIDSNGNVGIGGTPTTYRFEVYSGSTNITSNFVSTDAGAYILTTDSTGYAQIGNNGGTLELRPNGTNVANITSTGLGINTTPSYPLHIVNSSASRGLFIDQNNNGIALFVDSESTTSRVLDVLADAQTSGDIARFYTNSSSFSGIGVNINIEHASSTGTALEVKNDGTGYGVLIDQNGNGMALAIDSEATSNQGIYLTTKAENTYGLHVYADSITTGAAGFFDHRSASGGNCLYARVNSASASATCIRVLNEGTGYGVFIDQDGNGDGLYIDSEATTEHAIYVRNDVATTGRAIYAYCNSASFSAAGLFRSQVHNASATGNAFYAYNNGTGNTVVIDNNGSGNALYTDGGDVEVNEGNLSVYQGTGTSQFKFGASSNYYWDISRDNDVTGALIISNKNAGSVTERMRIDSSGNVEIDTGDLTVNGGALTVGNGTYNIAISTDETGASSSVSHNATYNEGIFWHTGNAGYAIYRTAGTWSSPNYDQLKLDWPTGIELDGGGQSYGKSGVNILNGNLQIDGTAIVDVNRNLINIGDVTTAGSISDEYGNVRDVPKVSGTKTSAYTLQAADAGRYVAIASGGSITIPNSVFSQGDVVTILCQHGSPKTITCSTTNAYITGDNTQKGGGGTVTIEPRGICTLLFTSGTAVYMSGNIS